MPINPFALRAALKVLDDQDIVIGKMVTVTWTVPANYATEGTTERSHTGPLAYLDRERGFYEIKPSNKSPGHYRGYLLAQSSTLRLAVEQEILAVTTSVNKGNPFINKAKAPPPAKKQETNPFLNPKPRPVKRQQGKQVNPFLKKK